MSYKNEAKINQLENYNLALTDYKKRDFQKALLGFQKVLENIPGDEPTLIYIERCQEYIKTPPPPEWDGVFVMKTK